VFFVVVVYFGVDCVGFFYFFVSVGFLNGVGFFVSLLWFSKVVFCCLLFLGR
jgi:hypothetical protein